MSHQMNGEHVLFQPSTDALVSNEAFRVLQHMFFLHPPTTAYMRAIFLQALKPEASNDSLQAHWKTISNVIRWDGVVVGDEWLCPFRGGSRILVREGPAEF